MLLDDTFQLLSNEYRRGIMYVLKEEEGDVFDYDGIAEGWWKEVHG